MFEFMIWSQQRVGRFFWYTLLMKWNVNCQCYYTRRTKNILYVTPHEKKGIALLLRFRIETLGRRKKKWNFSVPRSLPTWILLRQVGEGKHNAYSSPGTRILGYAVNLQRTLLRSIYTVFYSLELLGLVFVYMNSMTHDWDLLCWPRRMYFRHLFSTASFSSRKKKKLFTCESMMVSF